MNSFKKGTTFYVESDVYNLAKRLYDEGRFHILAMFSSVIVDPDGYIIKNCYGDSLNSCMLDELKTIKMEEKEMKKDLLELKISDIGERDDIKLASIVCNDYDRLKQIIENEEVKKFILRETGVGLDLIKILNHTEDDKLIKSCYIENLQKCIKAFNNNYNEQESKFEELSVDEKLNEIYKLLKALK